MGLFSGGTRRQHISLDPLIVALDGDKTTKLQLTTNVSNDQHV